jgi:hypothetical protein
MQKNQGNYEKILIIIMAVAAIAAGGWFIYASQTFPATLSRKTVTSKPFEENIPVKDIEEATQRAVADAHPWSAPVRNNKPVPLFKSVLLVLKGEEIFDMFLDEPALRPPLTNKWLRENMHNMEYLHPNVAELDPDDDGFTNLEEFTGNTDPNNPNSHPPITDKLFLVQRIEHKYLVTLKSAGDPPYQVTITTEDGRRRGSFVEIGKPFGVGGRFVAKKFEKKEVPDPRLGTKDVSELTVEDTLRKNEIVLVKDVDVNLAEYEGVFEFRLKYLKKVQAKKGDNFRIPGHEGTTYKVIDIQEDSAVIAPLKADGTPEKEIVIKRG